MLEQLPCLGGVRCCYSHNLYLPRTRVSKIQVQPVSLKFGSDDELHPKLSTFRHPFASISSFAQAGGHSKADREEHSHGPEDHCAKQGETGDEELPGMAKAFGISTQTATAISVVIALAALSFPLVMQSVSTRMDLNIKALSYDTLLFGFYTVWNIGANDPANAQGHNTLWVGEGNLIF